MSNFTKEDLLMTYIKGSVLSSKLDSLSIEDESHGRAAQGYLNILSTLSSQIETIKKLPLGSDRDQALQNLAATTKISACSNEALDFDSARRVCRLLSDYYAQVKSYQTPVDIKTHLAALGMLGRYAGPAGKIVGATSAVIGLATNYFVEAYDKSQITRLNESLGNLLDESQRQLLQDFPRIMTWMKTDTDSVTREAGDSALQVITDEEYYKTYVGLDFSATEFSIDALNPLEKLTLQFLQSSPDAEGYEQTRKSVQDSIQKSLDLANLSDQTDQLELAKEISEAMDTASQVTQGVSFVIDKIFGDPQTARAFTKIAGAAIETGKLVSGLLAGTVTGGLGIAASVIGIVGSLFSGPSSDELILNGINDIKNQLSILSNQMAQGLNALAGLSKQIIDRVNDAIKLEGKIYKLNIVEFKKIEQQLDALMALLLSTRREDIANNLDALALESSRLAAMQPQDDEALYRIRFCNLTAALVEQGTLLSLNSSVSGSNPTGGIDPLSVTEVLGQSKDLHYLTGYIAREQFLASSELARPVNPRYWSIAAKIYLNVLTTLPIPASIYLSLKSDILAFQSRASILTRLFEAMNLDILDALYQDLISKIEPLSQSIRDSTAVQDTIDRVTNNFGIPGNEWVGNIDNADATIDPLVDMKVGGNPWLSQPDPLVYGISKGFIRCDNNRASADLPTIPPEIQGGEIIRQTTRYNVVYTIQFVDSSQNVANLPWVPTIISTNLKSRGNEIEMFVPPYTITNFVNDTIFTGEPYEVKVEPNFRFAQLGLKPRTYTIDSIPTLFSLLIDTIQLQVVPQLIRELISCFDSITNGTSTSKPDEAIQQYHSDFQESYNRFVLYSSAIRAYRTGAVQTTRIENPLSDLQNWTPIYRSGFNAFLSNLTDSNSDRKKIQDPILLLQGAHDALINGIKTEITGIYDISKDLLSNQSQISDEFIGLTGLLWSSWINSDH